MTSNTEHNYVDELEAVQGVSSDNASFGGRKSRRNKTTGGKRRGSRRSKRRGSRRSKRRGSRRNKTTGGKRRGSRRNKRGKGTR
jgi:hypothetical protein